MCRCGSTIASFFRSSGTSRIRRLKRHRHRFRVPAGRIALFVLAAQSVIGGGFRILQAGEPYSPIPRQLLTRAHIASDQTRVRNSAVVFLRPRRLATALGHSPSLKPPLCWRTIAIAALISDAAIMSSLRRLVGTADLSRTIGTLFCSGVNQNSASWQRSGA
jgi:hypothetical protein